MSSFTWTCGVSKVKRGIIFPFPVQTNWKSEPKMIQTSKKVLKLSDHSVKVTRLLCLFRKMHHSHIHTFKGFLEHQSIKGHVEAAGSDRKGLWLVPLEEHFTLYGEMTRKAWTESLKTTRFTSSDRWNIVWVDKPKWSSERSGCPGPGQTN